MSRKRSSRPWTEASTPSPSAKPHTTIPKNRGSNAGNRHPNPDRKKGTSWPASPSTAGRSPTRSATSATTTGQGTRRSLSATRLRFLWYEIRTGQTLTDGDGSVRFGTVRYGSVQFGTVRYSSISPAYRLRQAGLVCKLRRHVATHPLHAPPARLRGHDAVSPENPRTLRRSLGTIVWRESLRVFTPHEKETDEPVRPCPGAMAPPVAVFPWLPGHARTAVRLCSPIPCAVGVLHGVSPQPTHGGLQPGNGARWTLAPFGFSFGPFRLRLGSYRRHGTRQRRRVSWRIHARLMTEPISAGNAHA